MAHDVGGDRDLSFLDACIPDAQSRRVLERKLGAIRDALIARIASANEETDPTLGSGLAGWAVSLASVAARHDDREALTAARRAMRDAMRIINRRSAVTLGLWDGDLGVLWARDQLVRLEIIAASGDDGLDRFDEHLATIADGSLLRLPWDAIGGLVGLGFYASGRRGEGAHRLAVRLVEAAAKTAYSDEHGVFWGFGGSHGHLDYPRPEAASIPVAGGIAHGVAGVIAFLASCVLLDRSTRDAKRLLEGALAWLAFHSDPSTRLWPEMVPVSRLAQRPRAASWCWGPAGAAIAMSMAARAIGGDRHLVAERWLGQISREARGDRSDVSLCHGDGSLALAAIATTSADSALHHVCFERLAHAVRSDWDESIAPDGGLRFFRDGSTVGSLQRLPSLDLLSGAGGILLLGSLCPEQVRAGFLRPFWLLIDD